MPASAIVKQYELGYYLVREYDSGQFDATADLDISPLFESEQEVRDWVADRMNEYED